MLDDTSGVRATTRTCRRRYTLCINTQVAAPLPGLPLARYDLWLAATLRFLVSCRDRVNTLLDRFDAFFLGINRIAGTKTIQLAEADTTPSEPGVVFVTHESVAFALETLSAFTRRQEENGWREPLGERERAALDTCRHVCDALERDGQLFYPREEPLFFESFEPHADSRDLLIARQAVALARTILLHYSAPVLTLSDNLQRTGSEQPSPVSKVMLSEQEQAALIELVYRKRGRSG